MSKPSIINRLKTAGSAHTAESMGTKNVDKGQLKNIYLVALISIGLLILVYGLIVVYSAVQNNEEYSY